MYLDARILTFLIVGPKWYSEILARCRDASAGPKEIEDALDRLARAGKIICPDGRWLRLR